MSELLNLQYDTEDYFARGKPKKEDVIKLRKWIIEQPEFIPKTLTDAQIVPFLIACKYDEEDTKKCVTEYFKAKKNGPEFFTKRDMDRDDLCQAFEALDYAVFPEDTPTGSRIVFHRLSDYNPSSYHMEVAMKVLFMSIDCALHNGPPDGLIILFDMQGLRLGHLLRTKIGAIRKFMHYVQDAIPIRLEAIHVLNTVYFVDKVMALIKPFMKPHLVKLLHFHPPGMEIEKLEEEWNLPKKCIPKDFGGLLPTVAELKKVHIKQLQQMVPFFSEEERQREESYNNNSNKIQNKQEKNSFKSLEID